MKRYWNNFPLLRNRLWLHSSLLTHNLLSANNGIAGTDGFAVGMNHCATRLVCVPNQSRGSTCRFIPAAKLSAFDGVVKRQDPGARRQIWSLFPRLQRVWAAAKSGMVRVCVCACVIRGLHCCIIVGYCRSGNSLYLCSKSWDGP